MHRHKATCKTVDVCADFEFGKSVTVDARRVDPTTVKQVYYFDSLSIVKSLETKGTL